mmetsp:Transcript_27947/g.70122  ORF Transcript_27947/g.70122 Transcript_27947/m.70122 type:complete len:528 (-) Transcript_27947:22-1605(-)
MPEGSSRSEFKDSDKQRDVRSSNIEAAKGLADAIRTSLGPKGMDKMIQPPSGDVIITNDGATILEKMQLLHPAAKMMVELSKSQDIEAGDGTTTVVVLAGSMLNACGRLLQRGIHPTAISESFLKAARKSEEVLRAMALSVDLADRNRLIENAKTSLNSKVVSQHSSLLAPLAVDAVLAVVNPAVDQDVDLNDIKVVKKLGGTVEDTSLVRGLVFTQRADHTAYGAPTRVQNAKIALIQFCLSSPKTNMDGSVVVTDHQQIDRILREESRYILNIVGKLVKAGVNTLLIQKSILRDAVNDQALHFLAKKKILVVKDIERSDIEHISKTLGCTPIASVEGIAAEKLGKADLVEELATTDGKIIKITGVPNTGNTVTVLCRGSNPMVMDECERSVHDALCVVRSLVKKRFIIPGGGAPEMQVSTKLREWAQSLEGIDAYCVRAYAEAFEVVPCTLAENAGLDPIAIVTDLRARHAEGKSTYGINVKRGSISCMVEENVLQPLLVSSSAFKLATETVAMIMKIDDIVLVR